MNDGILYNIILCWCMRRPWEDLAPLSADFSSWTAGPKLSTFTPQTQPVMRFTSSRTSYAWGRSTVGRYTKADRMAKSMSAPITIYTTSLLLGNRKLLTIGSSIHFIVRIKHLRLLPIGSKDSKDNLAHEKVNLENIVFNGKRADGRHR